MGKVLVQRIFSRLVWFAKFAKYCRDKFLPDLVWFDKKYWNRKKTPKSLTKPNKSNNLAPTSTTILENVVENAPKKFYLKILSSLVRANTKKIWRKMPQKSNKKVVLPENIEQFGLRQCRNQDQFELQPLGADLAQSWSSKTSLEKEDMISGCMDMIIWGYDMIWWYTRIWA